MDAHGNESLSWFEVAKRPIYTVTELTLKIKDILEEQFPFIWVEGEISNLKVPQSGHYYFTLKDESSQIRAILFRNQKKLLPFEPEDGLKVVCQGRISVYEPRGEYQILVDMVEPKGIGSLQLAFEQLKRRLEQEGLFDVALKKPIPYLPQRLAVVTSPTGAAIRDFLHIVERRFANVEIIIYPVRVQGDVAASEIATAIYDLNQMDHIDVIVLARGGGSLEDLWAFNQENVARAISQSSIPIVSAVGHETDFTIADFVADLRAPTPSAAAELVVKEKDELVSRIQNISNNLVNIIFRKITLHKDYLLHVGKRLIDPRRKLHELRTHLDEVTGDIRLGIQRHLKITREQLNQRIRRLHALSPLAILDRGYSITRTLPDLKVITDVKSVDVGDMVNVEVAHGEMVCRVEKKQRRSKHGQRKL